MPRQADIYAKKGRFDIRLDGLTETRASLQQLPEAFRVEIADSIEIGSRIILIEAAARVPVLTEELKNSLDRNVRADGLQAAVGSGLYRARFTEFGTVDTPAQPFLYPAYRKGARYVRGKMRAWGKEAGEKVRVRNQRSSRVKRASKK